MTLVDHLRGKLRALASAGRLGQFVSVGVVGFAFDITTSTALKELGVYPELAVFVGIEVAILVMFLLNDHWTFAEEGETGRRATLRRLATSNLVRGGGILVQLGVFVVVYRVFSLEVTVAAIDAWFVVAKAAGIATGMIVNYAAESLLTWRVHREG